MFSRDKISTDRSEIQDPSEALTEILNHCDKEPIHIPGSIQPHGYLIAFSFAGTVLYRSNNFEEIIHTLPAPPPNSLADYLGKETAEIVLKEATKLKRKSNFDIRLRVGDGDIRNFGGLLHKSDETFILELEHQIGNEPDLKLDFINESIRELEDAADPALLSDFLARRIRQLTGFDRVMVYQFKEDGSGVVIAENKLDGLSPFLGLHYPATDIPRQARQLYLLNPSRIIPNVYYMPVPLSPAPGAEVSQPLDLSFASLRSVSPVHIQYLINMEVGASMSFSIIRDNKLWGLVACHHSIARFVTYQARQFCELLAKIYSVVLGEKEEAQIRHYKEQIGVNRNLLFNRISREEKFTEGLHNESPTVKDLIRSEGCVIAFGDEHIQLGKTPAREDVEELTSWLQKWVKEDVFSTNELPLIYPAAKKFKDIGSGILAIAISKVQKEYIIWFRPEIVKTINWAGKQEQTEDETGMLKLSPRNSFQEWTEMFQYTAEPWLEIEREAAGDLRGLIVDIVMRMSGQLKLRADILSRLNQEMNSSKSEIDSFAYIASHDLKEPLRGIQNYATFVLEDYGELLDQEGQGKLKTLIRLSSRSQQLVDSLLQFSRLGRMELELEIVDFRELIGEVLEVFEPRFAEQNIELTIQDGKWPLIEVDRLKLNGVFMNLISNSIKYNDSSEKRIFVGFRKANPDETSPSGYVFFVRDNGIGIDPRLHDQVFTIFRRLNAREAYGGGTGAGLTITKKIIERHGGTIWLDSSPGEGSSFYFSI